MLGSSALLLVVTATARADELLTLDAFVERVVAGSLDARVAEAEARLAAAQRVGAGLWPNPLLEYERQTETGPNPLQDIVVASIPLVLSGRLGLEREAAELEAEAAEARLQHARAELRHAAAAAYLRLAAAGRRAEVLRGSIEELEGFVVQVTKREQAGESAGYDRVRLELERSVVENALRGDEAEVERLRTEAMRLLGPGVKALPPLASAWPEPASAKDARALFAGLQKSRADLQAAQLEVRAGEASAKAASRRVVPDPAITAGPMIVDGASTGAVVGVAVPLPLFDRGQGQQAVATARKDSAEERYRRLLHGAEVRLRGLLRERTLRAEQRTRHATDVLAGAEALSRIARAAYRGGESELLVLVDAERSLREARLGAIGLEADIHLTENDLLLLSGAYDR